MAYTRIQAVGYGINTFPVETPNVGFGEKYLGLQSSKNDIKIRCKVLKAAILQATTRPSIKLAANVLKVFMAPEFFFRNADGAYPIEEVSQIMESMRELVHRPANKDWLFVFGSALAYLEQEDGSKEVFNIALVQKGGTKVIGAGTALLVYKEYISHMDFIRGHVCPNCGESFKESWAADRTAVIGDPSDPKTTPTLLRPTMGSRDKNSLKAEPTGVGRERSKSGLGGQGIFTIDGITFGLEVCLDHALKRLRNSPPAKGEAYPQVHLIPSGGMSIEDAAIACVKRGVVFNVDAGHVALNRNVGDYGHPYAESRDHGNTPSTPDSFDELESFKVDLSAVPNWKKVFRKRGSVLIYDALPVPPAQTA